MRQFLLLTTFILAFGIFACSQNTTSEKAEDSIEEKEPQTEQKTSSQSDAENPHSNQENPHAGSGMSASGKKRKIIIPDSVKNQYKSVIVTVVDNSTGTLSSTERDILIGQKADVANTPLSIEIEGYLPDFVMSQDGAMTSKTAKENNPAAKVKIYDEQGLIFDGWLFKDFPGIHSFQHPVYDVELKGSVKK